MLAHLPAGADNPWQIEIRATSTSGVILDAFHSHEGGVERIKLVSSPAPDGNRLQNAVFTATTLRESTVNELHG